MYEDKLELLTYVDAKTWPTMAYLKYMQSGSGHYSFDMIFRVMVF